MTNVNEMLYASPKRAAQATDLSRSTLWRMAKRGELTTIRIGGSTRFLWSELKALGGVA